MDVAFFLLLLIISLIYFFLTFFHSLFFLIHHFLHDAVGIFSLTLILPAIFLFLCPRPYPVPLIFQSSEAPSGKKNNESCFAPDCAVFPSRVILFFYSNLCPQSRWCLLCSEGDSDCFLLPYFLTNEECRWQGTRGEMHPSL